MKQEYSRRKQLIEATKKVDEFILFVLFNSEDDEEWKEIMCGYERYFVSSKGRILSIQKPNPLIMTPSNSNGYKYITICNHGTKTQKRVNRLVADAFLPNPEEKKVVHHKDHNKDHNKANNSIENLQWATHSENIRAYNDYKKKCKEEAINGS